LVLATAPCLLAAESLAPSQRAQLTNIPRAKKPSVPGTEQTCVGPHHFWVEQGPAHGVKSCAIETTDAHKICTDSSQCEGACLVAQDLPIGKPAIGSCSDWIPKYGCYKFIADNRVREICAD
jgi:hypothetical protein